RTLAEDPGRASPELRIPGAAAQTRVVSMAGIRLGASETVRARLVSPAQASLPRSWPTLELRIPNAAAQTRIVSKARIRLDSGKSVRSFKGIIWVDISESPTCPATQSGRCGAFIPFTGFASSAV